MPKRWTVETDDCPCFEGKRGKILGYSPHYFSYVMHFFKDPISLTILLGSGEYKCESESLNWEFEMNHKLVQFCLTSFGVYVKPL